MRALSPSAPILFLQHFFHITAVSSGVREYFNDAVSAYKKAAVTQRIQQFHIMCDQKNRYPALCKHPDLIPYRTHRSIVQPACRLIEDINVLF